MAGDGKLSQLSADRSSLSTWGERDSLQLCSSAPLSQPWQQKPLQCRAFTLQTRCYQGLDTLHTGGQGPAVREGSTAVP